MNLVFTALIGLLGGLFSGVFGVGGGAIFVPLLILSMRFSSHLAVGTSLAVIVPTALVAAFGHGRAGMIDWKSAFLLSLFAILGAWFGAQLSLRLDEALLRKLYGLFLAILAFKMFFTK